MKIQYRSEELVLFESALYRTITTLVIGPDYLLLVDPNWLPIEIDYIAAYVEPYQQGRAAYLLFTHSDYDHIIAYERFAHYTVIASQAFVDNPHKEKVLAEIRAFDDENYIQRSYGISYPQVDIVVAHDGESLHLGKTANLVIAQAPGHNGDGLFAYLPTHQLLIVGDYLCNVEIPFLYHSLSDYHRTLDKLAAYLNDKQLSYLVTGHGDMATTLREMRERLAYARQYLNDLEIHVRKGTPFPLTQCLEPYPWPEGLRRAHEKNMELIKRELQL